VSELAAETFLTEDEHRRVREAIAAAERRTSGEIRVHLEDRCEDELMDHAAFIFKQLNMDRTRERNGVLIYVSAADHRVAVIGDAGIHARVGHSYWEEVLATLIVHFKEGRHAEGLIAAIERTGEKLREHFPFQRDDRDELSNEISVDR
jgi:uncharacterized membrane protein